MTPKIRERLLVLIGSGATIDRLSEEAGVQPRSFKRWLAEGRKDPDSEYAWLAEAFDSRGPALGSGPMTDEEYELHLAAAIRARNVQAMKIYEDRRAKRGDEDADEDKPADPLEGIDELATRRTQRAA